MNLRLPKPLFAVLLSSSLLYAQATFAQVAPQAARPELVIQTGHTGPVFALAASPNGQWLASGSVDSTVRIWDVEAGRELRALTGHTGIVSAVAFSPNGQILASGSYDHTVKLWDVATGKEIRTIVAHGDPVASVTFGPDGRWLASASWWEIKIWDLATGSELRNLVPRGRALNSVAFSPDGKIFATNDVGGFISLHDAGSGRKLRDLSYPGRLATVCFSPDGRLLATAGKEIALWDVASGRQVRTFTRHSSSGNQPQSMPLGGLREIVFSRDGQSLISGSNDKTVTIWDVATGQELRTLSGSPGEVGRVAAGATGQWIASASEKEDVIRIWDPRNGQLVHILGGQVATSLAVTFTADVRRILTGASSGGIGEWDFGTGRPGRGLAGHANTVTALRISPDGKLLASASWDHTIKLWNLSTGEPKVLTGHSANVYTIAFSPDGQMLASGSLDMTVRLWDVATGRELRSIDLGKLGPQIIKGSNDQIAAVAFSPDGRILACTDQRYTIKFFETATGQELRTLKGHTNNAEALAFSPDGRILASGSYDDTVRLWDVASGRELRSLLAHVGAVSSVAFSPDGRRLVSASHDNDIDIWDVASGTKLRTLSGHASQVWSINLSRDGRWLASCGLDGSTRIWDVATGELKAVLINMNNQRDWLITTPDGLFDGSPGAWQQILWRFNNSTADIAPVEMFFNDFYHPGLLADILGGKHPQAKKDLATLDRRLPSVKLSVLDGSDAGAVAASRLIKVRLQVAQAPADKDHPAGSGARDVRLFRNGSLVRLWHGDALHGAEQAVLDAEVPIVAGENRLTAYAFNHENVKSPDASLSVSGAESLKRKGVAYILAVGINQYASADWNLRYAAPDARDFADEIEKNLQHLGRFQAIKTVSLLDADATKANFASALERLAGRKDLPGGAPGILEEFAPAQPEDAIFIYFAGHGTTAGSRAYLIPHDLGFDGRRNQLDEDGVNAILSHSLSDLELENHFEQIDAGELVLIIDACRSGQALQADDPRQGPMNSRGLAQLAYDKGMYILAASQGYQAALEMSLYKHGLLTYALIDQGLRSGMADDDPKDGEITLREWLDFATQDVPQLQMDAMEEANRRGDDLAVVEGEQKIKDLNLRSLQHPRVFYRREPEAQPFVVGTSGAFERAAQ